MDTFSLTNVRKCVGKQASFVYLLAAASLILLLPWMLYKQPQAAAPEQCHEEPRLSQLGKLIYDFFLKDDTPKMEPKANLRKVIWDLLKKLYNGY